MDSILWREESDHYTERALKAKASDIDALLAHHRDMAVEGKRVMDSMGFTPRRVLDIGCGYGGFVQAFGELYPRASFMGVDPGLESIATARRVASHGRAEFMVGHGHDLPFDDESFDLVLLVMVLQWVPRAYLARTIAQVERVLRVGGLILLWDFMPFKMVMSQSRHNDQVYIFKNDYKDFFTAYPWLRLVHHYVKRLERGPDYQFSCSFIKKIPIEQVYDLVPGPTEG